MTEESQDGTTQQLSESDKTDEKPAQDNPDEKTEQNSVQLASGAPENSGPVTQEESSQEQKDENSAQSKAEDGPTPQEPGASEGGELVKDPDNEGPATEEEQGQQKESEEDKPTESADNEQNTIDKEDSGEGSDGDKQAEVQQRGESAQQEESNVQTPSEDQQAEVKPEGQSEQTANNEGNEEEEGGITCQVGQEEGGKPPQGEEDAEKPVAEPESQDAVEEQGDEPAKEKEQDCPVNEQTLQETLPNETDPESENQIPLQDISQAEAVENTDTTEDSVLNPNDTDEADGETKPEMKPEESEQTKPRTSTESEPTDVKQEGVSEEFQKPVEDQEQIQQEAQSTVQPAAITTTQIVAVPVDETPPSMPDELHEENKKLKQDMFMMKQQEDAYRIKVLSLEQEVGKLRARKIDNRSQDSLASDSDSYLKQKLAETERDLDTAERKVKDLQLRLKRFAKDDQIKDEKIFQMEKEVKELSEHTKKLEQSIADSKKENNNNAMVQASTDKNDSKVCVIL